MSIDVLVLRDAELLDGWTTCRITGAAVTWLAERDAR